MPGSTTLPRASRLPLAIVCAATLMTIVDETVVSVALPTIQRDVGFGDGSLSWVVNAYLIAFGGLLLLAGRVGDLVGRRRVLLGGLALFTAASVACGAAQSAGWLVTARFAQGAGGAMAAAVALGMLVALFDDERHRARAIGIYAFVGASGASIGLFAGGVITEVLSWRWAFFINVPIGLVTLAAGLRAIAPDAAHPARGSADVPGALLLVAGLMVVILAIVGAETHGFASSRTLASGALGMGLLALFAARQATATRPLLAVRVLRSRVVAVANVVQALTVGAMFGFQFLVTLYFQRVLGFGPAEAGLAVLPVAVGIGFVSLVLFPRLSARWGALNLLLVGLVAIAAGLALLAGIPADGRYLVDVAPSVALFGAGAGLSLPAVMTLAMSAASPEDAGQASGLINTSQQVGGALGLAIVATLAAGRTDTVAGQGVDAREALVEGYRLAWTIGAGWVLVAAALAALALAAPRWARRADNPREGAAAAPTACRS